jgi:hypothetical protein
MVQTRTMHVLGLDSTETIKPIYAQCILPAKRKAHKNWSFNMGIDQVVFCLFNAD